MDARKRSAALSEVDCLFVSAEVDPTDTIAGAGVRIKVVGMDKRPGTGAAAGIGADAGAAGGTYEDAIVDTATGGGASLTDRAT